MSRQNSNSVRMTAIKGSGLFLLTILGLSGCNQYFERQDSITLGVGDSVAQNKAAHTIHPWPPGSGNPHHSTNGARALIAIKRYEKNESIEPDSIRTQTSVKGGKK